MSSKVTELTNNPIWNLPIDAEERTARSPAAFIPALEAHFGPRSVQALEIGVFQGGFAKRLHESSLDIVSYDGIDPFSGSKDDPYANSEHYWMNETEADQTYHKTRSLLNTLDYHLHRKTSMAFFSDELAAEKTFDLIHVDGDHRYHQALFDMKVSFAALADGGILAIDDYANADTSGVTWAFDTFYRDNQADIQRIGYVSNWFQPSTKPAPMAQATIYLEPMPQAKRKNKIIVSQILAQENENPDSPPPSWGQALLDASPRKIIRRLLGK